jgi:hypothetical protein
MGASPAIHATRRDNQNRSIAGADDAGVAPTAVCSFALSWGVEVARTLINRRQLPHI